MDGEKGEEVEDGFVGEVLDGEEEEEGRGRAKGERGGGAGSRLW